MTTLMQQSIEHSFRENMKIYPGNYPLSGNGPSDDAIGNLVEWVENGYKYDENDYSEWGGKGTIEEWFEIAIRAYIDYFDFEDDEPGDTYTYCKEQVDHVKTMNAKL
jgi:hypothetical protein